MDTNQSKPQGEKINIVIIDDEADALELTDYFLKQIPEVDVLAKYDSPRKALRGLKTMDAPPHIVFTDISMPEMDGIQLCRKIRCIHPEVQFVFITAYNHFAPYTQEIQPIGFLQKPVEASELHHSIKLFLARKA
ncbi:MAG: LytR/AlgR family response regulator transcription factor [Bacteroidota bacterium]